MSSDLNISQGQLRQLLRKLLDFQELGIILPLVAFCLFVGLRHPEFFSAANQWNIAREVAFIGVIACVMTFVLVSGGIDLSVGSVLGVSGVLTALCLVNEFQLIPSIVVGLLAGAVCGLLNGLAVVLLRIPPVIVTLGMLYAARGVVLILTEGKPLVHLPKSFQVLGQGALRGVPIPVVILVLTAVVTHIILTRTRYGYWIRAMGGNRESARLSGLSIRRLEISVHVFSGLASGVVGVLLTSRLSAAFAQTGRTWELLVIASVIIGGTSLFGGVGTVIGSLAGAGIIRVLSNALVFLEVSAYWQEVCIGVIIIAAVAIDAHTRRLKLRHQTQDAQPAAPDKSKRALNLDVIYSATPANGETAGKDSHAPILEMQDISKHFGHVRAMEEVSLELYPGEVLALVGDNGAGKSTLIKVVSGALTPDRGVIRLAGKPVTMRNPRDADNLGIATVYQDLALVDCLDVAANLFLGREPASGGFVKRTTMRTDARKILEGLRIHVPSLRVSAGDLSGGQRQAVAIAKSLLQGGRIVIMDEPTAALGVEEQAKVLELIGRLRAKGCSVILISHNLNHVFAVADRLAVLRGGRMMGTWPRATTTVEEIIAMMTGADQLKAEMALGS